MNQLIITDCSLFSLPLSLKYSRAVIAPTKQMPAPLPCCGCFKCWTQTPGRCVLRDGYRKTGELLAAVTELILISRCVYGSLSPFVKGVLDRAIAYVLPYFEICNGEMHHRPRYPKSLAISLYAYGPGTTPEEQNTLKAIVAANAVNLHAIVRDVAFFKTADEAFSMLKPQHTTGGKSFEACFYKRQSQTQKHC